VTEQHLDGSLGAVPSQETVTVPEIISWVFGLFFFFLPWKT